MGRHLLSPSLLTGQRLTASCPCPPPSLQEHLELQSVRNEQGYIPEANDERGEPVCSSTQPPEDEGR